MHAAFWESLGQTADILGQCSEMSGFNSNDDEEDDYELSADDLNEEDLAPNSVFPPVFPFEYAADAAASAIRGPLAPIPQLHLRKPDCKHQARYPYVLGGFDTDVVTVDWNLCNGQNVLDIFTCKMFGSGRGAQKTMGVWARELMKFLKSICSVDDVLAVRIDAVLKGTRSALQHEDFDLLLQTILAKPIKLLSARSFLVKYARQHVLHCVCKAFFPSITEVQIGQSRFFIHYFFIFFTSDCLSESVP